MSLSKQSIGGARHCSQTITCPSNALSPQSLPTPLFVVVFCGGFYPKIMKNLIQGNFPGPRVLVLTRLHCIYLSTRSLGPWKLPCCPRRTKFGRGLWNGLRTCVCASVCPSDVEICFFSVISWPILILFVLSDRASWGLQNFYTEFWNSLIMQIYANLFKINEKCYFSISWPILILFVLSDRAGWGLQNFYTEFWNSLIMRIYANLFKINEKCRLSSIQKSQQICTSGGDVYYASRNLLSTCYIRFLIRSG